MNSTFIAELQTVWAEIDRATADCQRRTGLSCPADCGKCCATHTVETTMPEMLPLAAELWRRGEAEQWLALLEQHPEEKACVLYRPHPADRQRGACSFYALRPSTCRLFGFAGRINKHGRRELNACEVHKQTQPLTVTAAADSEVPLFETFFRKITGLAPELDWQLLPINQALLLALRRVGFWLEFAQRRGDAEKILFFN